jgi:F-type H+-transporting ATPase subunit a
MPEHKHGPIDHVVDSSTWHFFDQLFEAPVELALPTIDVFGWHVQLTKFMILEVVAAVLICAIFIPLARKVAKGGTPTGAWWNAFEVLLTFIRDQVAQPTLCPPPDYHEHLHEGHAKGGHHDEQHAAKHDPLKGYEHDAYVPYLWTVFLFILFCNLLGLIPFMGSPTASLYVTGALALCSFIMMHGAAIAKMGFGSYVKSLWPPMDIPYGLGYFIKPLIFFIELMGTFIKSAVLAVRLFANMFAGHMVLATILFFIVSTANVVPVMLWGGITVSSVLGQVALSLLELFVAFLQAYVFVFLTALFIGMSLYPQH